MSGVYFFIGALIGADVALNLTGRRRNLTLPQWSLKPKYLTIKVVLTDGPHAVSSCKIQVIKAIRQSTGAGLHEAKEQSEGVQFTLPRAQGEALNETLRALGAVTATYPTRTKP